MLRGRFAGLLTGLLLCVGARAAEAQPKANYSLVDAEKSFTVMGEAIAPLTVSVKNTLSAPVTVIELTAPNGQNFADLQAFVIVAGWTASLPSSNVVRFSTSTALPANQSVTFPLFLTGLAGAAIPASNKDETDRLTSVRLNAALLGCGAMGAQCQPWKRHGLALTLVATPESVRIGETVRLEYRVENRSTAAKNNIQSVPAAPTTTVAGAVTGPAATTPASVDINTNRAGALFYDAVAALDDTTFQFRAFARDGSGTTSSPPRTSNRVAVGDLTAILFVEPTTAISGQAFDVVMRVQNNGQTNTSDPALFGTSAIGNVRPAADPTFTGTAASSTRLAGPEPALVPSLAYKGSAEFRWSYSATAPGVATYSFSGQAVGNGTQSVVGNSNVGTIAPATLTVFPRSIARGDTGPLTFTAANDTGTDFTGKLVLQFPPDFDDPNAITGVTDPPGYVSTITNGAGGARVTYTPTGPGFPDGTTGSSAVTFSPTGIPAIPVGQGDKPYVVSLAFRNDADTANLFMLTTEVLVTAQRVTLTVSPGTIAADGNATTVLTATVTNAADGSPVGGVRVRFTKTVGTLSAETVTTLPSGVATTVLTAPVSTTTIVSSVSATYLNATDSATVTFTGVTGPNLLYVGGTLFPRQVAPGSVVGFGIDVQNVGTADAVLTVAGTTFNFQQSSTCTFQATLNAPVTVAPGQVLRLGFTPTTVLSCFTIPSSLFATFTYNPTRTVNDSLSFTATPTFASVVGLDAEAYGDGAILRWSTDLEFANAGFRVLRADGAGDPEVVEDAWIPASGESFSDYQWIDAPLAPGVYSYWIEDVALDGLATRHGPVVLALGTQLPGGGESVASVHGEGRSQFDPLDDSLWTDPSDLGDVRILAEDADGITYEIVPPPYEVTPVPYPVELFDRLRIARYGILEEIAEPELPVRQLLVPVPERMRGRLELLSLDDRQVTGLRPTRFFGQANGDMLAGLETTVGAFDWQSASVLRPARRGAAAGTTFPRGPIALVDRGRMGDRPVVALVVTPLRWSDSDAALLVADRIVVRVHFEPAPDEAATAPDAARLAQERILSGPSLKVSATGAGLVRVPRSAVLAAGAGTLEDAAVYRLGAVVPSRVEGDELLFVIPPFRSFHDARQAWWIAPRPSGAKPLVIPRTGAATIPAAAADVTARTARFEEENVYAMLDGAGEGPDRWYWATMSAGGALASAQVTFDVPRVETGAPAELTVTLQGMVQDPSASDEHVVRLLLNGVALETVTFSDFERRAFTLAVPGGVLAEGANSLALEAVSAKASQVGLDAIDLRWNAPAEAQGAPSLRVNALAGGLLTATGFAEAPVFAVDETDPEQPALLEVSVAQANGAWSASVTAPPGAAIRFVTSSAASPATWAARAPLAASALSPLHGADYVVISASELVDAADGFARWRRSAAGGGMRAATFDADDLHDAFAFGDVDPIAVPRFLRHARDTWPGAAPRYALLVGTSTYDPRDHLGLGTPSGLLLSGRVSTGLLNAASDNVSAMLGTDDALPDLAIGRIPARDTAAVQAMLAKSQAYESAPRDGWDRRHVLMADDDLPDFDRTTEESAWLLPRGVEARRISAAASGATGSRDALLGGIADGAAVVTYVGHGGLQTWGGESYLQSQDAPLLANARLPVVVAVNCLNGFFDHPSVDSLAEALLLADGQGAAAMWTSSAITRNGGHRELALAFQQTFWREPDLRLGDAVNRALAHVAWRDDARELIGSFVLLGDPALRPNVNAAPVARARVLAVDLGRAVLSGADSSDADGDALAWRWEVVSAPAGATATLHEASDPEATLVGSHSGTYRVRLRVADASLAGPADDVVVELVAPAGSNPGFFLCSVSLPAGGASGSPALLAVLAGLVVVLRGRRRGV